MLSTFGEMPLSLASANLSCLQDLKIYPQEVLGEIPNLLSQINFVHLWIKHQFDYAYTYTDTIQ